MLELRKLDEASGSIVIETRSNVSMTLDRLTAVFVAICALTLLVAAWPVLMGLWPVLLAALVHLAIVGWCFRAAWRGNWAREILRIEGEQLRVNQFRAGQQSHSEWPVAWTRILTESGRLGDLRVYLATQGRRREVGAFLPVSERAELAGMLDHALRPLAAWRCAPTIRVS